MNRAVVFESDIPCGAEHCQRPGNRRISSLSGSHVFMFLANPRTYKRLTLLMRGQLIHHDVDVRVAAECLRVSRTPASDPRRVKKIEFARRTTRIRAVRAIVSLDPKRLQRALDLGRERYAPEPRVQPDERRLHPAGEC